MSVEDFTRELKSHSNPEKAKFLQGYFKTGKGYYGEGDVFLGITVPLQRSVARKYIDLSLNDYLKLLKSKIHEYRFSALEALAMKYRKGTLAEKAKIYKFYLQHRKYINNWDLVDTSAPSIVGEYFFNKSKTVLYKLARSKNVWDRRITIIATQYFIRQGQFSETLKIAKLLLKDGHDLIHKASGWMLREVGNREEETLIKFLDLYAHKMPRTMLRYAVERLNSAKRKHYLSKKT